MLADSKWRTAEAVGFRAVSCAQASWEARSVWTNVPLGLRLMSVGGDNPVMFCASVSGGAEVSFLLMEIGFQICETERSTAPTFCEVCFTNLEPPRK